MVFLNLVLLVVLMELGALVVLSFLPPDPSPNDTERSPYFSGRSWAREYWREFKAATSHVRYHPYILWRFAPFEGKLIRVDAEGLRVTPGTGCGPRAQRVWVFGGSTVWGLGSPDDETIPAYLQRLLSGGGCVVNFGQLGFTSTQGVVQLESELRNGRRPNVVVFYDGVNDAVAAFSYQRPGLHMGLSEIREKLESPAFVSFVTSTNQYRLVRRMTARLAPALPRSDAPVNGTVSGYLVNVEIVKALARAYGFRAVFFWQPNVLIGAKPLAEEERNARQHEWIAPFMRRVYTRFLDQSAGITDLYDLAGIFDHDTSVAYLDWHHTTPEANGKIAQTIASVIFR